MKKLLIIIISIISILIIIAFSINFYILIKYDKNIISEKEVSKLKDIDCILVLGAGVKSDGRPSDMLRDRLIESSNIYQNSAIHKIIVSGDHSSDTYDEVFVMKDYLINKLNIESNDIYKDHYGIATYDSIYRAKEVYSCKKMIIVTQKYHLYRSLYLADKIGIDAYGVSASLEPYRGQLWREIREVLARDKDFVKGLILPTPKFKIEALPASATGDDTNER